MSLTLQELIFLPGEIEDLANSTRDAAKNHTGSADFYRSLSRVSTWEGAAGEAASDSMERIARDHDAVAENLDSAAVGMDGAHQDAEDVANKVKGILNYAAEAPGVEVNTHTNQVIAPDTGHLSDEAAAQVAAKVADLQEKVTGALAEGAGVNVDLAEAIKTATDDEPVTHDARPEVQQALSGVLPEDPDKFNELWEQLSDEQKDWLYSQDHSIGKNPGMPFEDRTHYNELYLEELTAAKQAEIDRLAQEHPAWAAGGKPHTRNPNPPAYREWKKQWDAAHHDLDGYNAAHAALDSKDGPKRYLANIDDQGRAAIAINNPDTADNVATFVPGMNSTLAGIGGDMTRAENLLDAANKADPFATTSVVTWYDYNAPQDLGHAASGSSADAGAPRLDTFQDGLRASHEGAPSHNTIVAHSYGTLVTGTAASDGGSLAVDDIVLAGSPGIGVNNVTELRLDGVNPADNHSHVYATASPMDPVPRIGSVLGNLAHGPNPVSDSFGATTFKGDSGWPWNAHSNYWEPGNPALATQGKIIAGSGP